MNSARAEDRPVDVGLGGEVDDGLTAAAGSRDRGGVGDVPRDDLDVDPVEVPRIPGVRQLVEHDDLVTRCDEALDEVAADEAAAAGDEEAHRPRMSSPSDQRSRARHARRPSRQCGRRGVSGFSLRSTE